MPKVSGIIGVDHVAVFTGRVEETERHYEELFDAVVLFRVTQYRGTWATIDRGYGWQEIKRRGVKVDSTFMRAGGLTIAISAERSSGKEGPVNHVGIGCSDPEFRRIRAQAGALELRFLEDGLTMFKFVDRFGVIWEVSRGMEPAPPATRLDIGTGQLI